MHLVARSRKGSIEEKLLDSFSKVHGAYSLVILTHEKLIAVRDPLGFRPLVLGKKGDGYIVASETCALDLVDATFVREIAPGEMLSIDDSGLHSTRFESHTTLNQPVERKGFCSFETIYFSRPDSRVFGDLVYEKRILLGEELVYEEDRPPKDFADVVIAVPDSGVPMAMGYARASGLAYEIGLVRNHYIGRTFIEPTQSIRDFGVKLKLNPVETVLKGKRVVVVDDSLVRGTTSTKILRMLKNAGAKEIHMRISSPPITGSCYFGVDTPSRKHLLAANNSIEEMCAFVGATSLKFLSQKGLAKVLGDNKSTQNFCYGCFGHGYPEKTFAS
jgi:amidophosphoribosyltransferase